MKRHVGIIMAICTIVILLGSCTSSNEELSSMKPSGGVVDSESKPVSTIKSSENNLSNSFDYVIELNNKEYDLEEKFTEFELEPLSIEQLAFLRNGVYAKYGYSFSGDKYKKFFSEYSWYVENTNNVESNFSKTDQENIELILALEKIDGIDLHYSEEDNRIGNSVILKGNQVKVSKEYLEESGYENKPIRITITLNESEVQFESIWNDGVSIAYTDFDISDEYVEIYIIEAGTDIGCRTYIYQTDGKKLVKSGEIDHLGTEFLYDQLGRIYFCNIGDNGLDFDYYYDYKTKEIGPIKSKRLKEKIDNIYAEKYKH